GHVTAPGLDQTELAGVVERDVDRLVPALRQTADPSAGARRDSSESSVYRPDHVAGDERLPRVVRSRSVGPLAVRLPGRRGDDLDERPDEASADHVRLQERALGAIEELLRAVDPVEHVHDRIALG